MKNLTWQNPEQLFVAQELINKVKSKCCGIKVNYTTLQEIQKNRYPDVTGRVMFMIESFFIMTDAQSYKLDADYIARTELLNSKDFDAFKDYPPFSIIRVLTKRDRTVRVR